MHENRWFIELTNNSVHVDLFILYNIVHCGGRILMGLSALSGIVWTLELYEDAQRE